MFSEKYKKDNENIIPSDATKRYIKSKLSEETNKPARRFNYNAVIATALSLVLALGVTFIAKKTAPTIQTSEVQLNQSVTYNEIFNTINKCITDNKYGYLIESANGTRDDAGISIDYSADTGTTTGGTTDFNSIKGSSSTTNNQVVGVDEADIVKNDGRYIYSVKNGQIIITDSNNGNPKIATKYTLAENENTIKGLFVNGNRLAVIVSCFNVSENYIKLIVFDITNKESITEIANKKQDGWYAGARMIEDTVYLLSNYGINQEIVKTRPETFVPTVAGCTVACDDISVIEGFKSPDYLVVSSVNINSGEVNSSAAVLGGAQNIYCSKQNLYYTFSKQITEETDNKVYYQTETTIVKVKLGEKIETVATGNVKGFPLNQFSMDEYEGNLRIVTTINLNEATKNGDEIYSYISDFTTKNALYVLDSNLAQIGKIEDLAKDERVYSVRFDGAVGYFVTFRQVDPLFTVDLTDPKNPKILSELKIPGFSEYLHPYGEGRLFGFGKSATDEGIITGLKISMFDVSNPTDVSELHLSSVPADWSEASEDHKAIMVDVNKNIIAFLATDMYAETSLFVYGYSEGNGFFKKAVCPLEKDNFFHGARFVWIDNHFYLVTQKGIITFTLDTFEQLSHLQF